MPKEIIYGPNARSKIAQGMCLVSDAVKATLGPKGSVVFISKPYGEPVATKDGVTVAKSIELADKFHNMGASLIKSAAQKTNDEAGDGTTTTAVLAWEIVKEAERSVRAGVNPAALSAGMEAAVAKVVAKLQEMAVQITSKEQLKQVATISANGDKEIGEVITEAFGSVEKAKDTVVTVSIGQGGAGLELDRVEGLKIDRGFISPYFITNAEKMLVEFENPYILVVDGKISTLAQILTLLEELVKTGKPMLIIADDVEGEALTSLIVNKIRGGLKVAAIKAPGFSDRRKAMLEDIAIITGAQLISEDLGVKMEGIRLHDLGKATKVVISKDDTVIVGTEGDTKKISARAEQLRAQIVDSKGYDREMLEKRLASFTGGVAVISVGGMTEVESKERKDRVDDALNATRAALAEGIVPGGGCALLYASKALKKLAETTSNHDEKLGIGIVERALRAPFIGIMRNVNMDQPAEVVLKTILDSDSNTTVFDVFKGEYGDAFKIGLVDPARVARIALQSAASVAALVATAECAIADLPEDNKKNGGASHGMGDMDGGMY